MAEASVEEREANVPRFYCHRCDLEIHIPNLDFVCPVCTGGFVEQLPDSTVSTADQSETEASAQTQNRTSTNANRDARFDALRGEITTLLMSRNGPNVEISVNPGNRSAGGRVRPQNLDPLDNVLIDFLHSITGEFEIPIGNSSMAYLGNIGDYAWGREGIDAIVTHLLNQGDTQGPPPMTKDKIAEIPKVEVSSLEVDRKTQCSVCWEDFQLSEIVRKLQCSHIFHENCIVPWLELNCTCPICRKPLVEESDQVQQTANRFVSSTSNTNAASRPNPTQRVTLRPGNTSNSTTNYGNTRIVNNGSTSPTNNQTNNVFTFDDSNIDLD